MIEKDGRHSTIGYRHVGRFAVVRERLTELAPGDRLQLKANGRSMEGIRLHNGELVTVERVEKVGAIKVVDERGTTKTLSPAQRLFVHAYAVTSYASQGKTVDAVILADAGGSTADTRHWYVGISRGRRRVVVLTSDKEKLRDAIVRSGEFERARWEERRDVAEREYLARRQRRFIRSAIQQE